MPRTIQQCQQALIDLGYDVGPDGADGEGGPNTQKAILAFQAANGLDTTGQFDRWTMAKLFPQPRKGFDPRPSARGDGPSANTLTFPRKVPAICDASRERRHCAALLHGDRLNR